MRTLPESAPTSVRPSVRPFALWRLSALMTIAGPSADASQPGEQRRRRRCKSVPGLSRRFRAKGFLSAAECSPRRHRSSFFFFFFFMTLRGGSRCARGHANERGQRCVFVACPQSDLEQYQTALQDAGCDLSPLAYIKQWK